MADAVKSLIDPDTKIKCVKSFHPIYSDHESDTENGRVSSTLDKSVRKKYLIDGSPETCWTSQQVCYLTCFGWISCLLQSFMQGTPQYIQLTFASPVTPKRVEFTFQGGFVGTKCAVEALRAEEQAWTPMTRIYPEDVNRKQTFDLCTGTNEAIDWQIEGLKFSFEESSDFFGRVTVYDLQLFGTTAN